MQNEDHIRICEHSVTILVHSLHTWSVSKVMRLIQYNSIFILKLQIEFVPFKIVPLGGYTSPETFPIFLAALEATNRNHF
jgi:hypothetical protein